jgi:hypothetical protein
MPERRVLVLTRDLFFRARLQGVVRAGGGEPCDVLPADLAVVELSGAGALERVRELTGAGCEVLAFGPHTDAESLRAARAAGARAVPNSQVETEIWQWLAHRSGGRRQDA